MSVKILSQSDLVQTRLAGEVLHVAITGHWKLTEQRVRWQKLLADQKPARVVLDFSDLQSGDSALLLFIRQAEAWCAESGATLEKKNLPDGLARQLGLLEKANRGAAGESAEPEQEQDILSYVGVATGNVVNRARELVHFLGECSLSVAFLFRNPHKFRWSDCLEEMQRCGAMALPIVGLVGLLVGQTLAYTAAVLLRQFGADIYVADFVGVVMTRVMGPVMTAIVLAGRTGAAYAATIGNMKANEEVDALVTYGIRPVDFLVIPRLVALVAMMPLLAIYANALGIFGGMVVAFTLLDIPPTAYWVELLTIVDLGDLITGTIMAVTFGVIVAVSGCLRGLQADRSAMGVGKAATSSVVASIFLIILSTALYSILFNFLGI